MWALDPRLPNCLWLGCSILKGSQLLPLNSDVIPEALGKADVSLTFLQDYVSDTVLRGVSGYLASLRPTSPKDDRRLPECLSACNKPFPNTSSTHPSVWFRTLILHLFTEQMNVLARTQ